MKVGMIVGSGTPSAVIDYQEQREYERGDGVKFAEGKVLCARDATPHPYVIWSYQQLVGTSIVDVFNGSYFATLEEAIAKWWP